MKDLNRWFKFEPARGGQFRLIKFGPGIYNIRMELDKFIHAFVNFFLFFQII